jgi:tetratricopeptide (TPR) repeat protein
VRTRLGIGAPSPESNKSAAYEGYVAALGFLQRYDKPGNLDRAIAQLRSSLKADPLFALAYAQLAESYRLKFETERDPKWLEMALQNGERAEELDTRLPAAYSTLAKIHNEQGKHDLALQEFHQALEINPRDPAALRGIARSDVTAGRIDDAEQGLRKVIAILPDDWDGYDELGNFYAGQGKYAEAIAQYKQGLDLAPDNAQLYSNLGSVYLDSGDPKLVPRAEEALQKSLAINPTYPALANLAALYSEEQRYSESAVFSQRALQLNDHSYIVWDTLRIDYEATGDSAAEAKAASGEQKVLEDTVSRSQDAMAQAMLGNLYARSGNPDKARARIDSALSLSPNDPQVLLEVADGLANLHDRTAAIGYIREAVKKGAQIEAVKTDVELKRLNVDFDKVLRTK